MRGSFQAIEDVQGAFNDPKYLQKIPDEMHLVLGSVLCLMWMGKPTHSYCGS